MNIFVLDRDPRACAQAHCDQHVVKMILESVQLMCTALTLKGIPAPYKPTHQKHPCVKWVGESWSNYVWLSHLVDELHTEYHWRYPGKPDHASMQVFNQVRQQRFADIGLTGFAQAMPDEYKVPGDAVTAYRNFYCAEKSHFARWTRRGIPEWFRVDQPVLHSA